MRPRGNEDGAIAPIVAITLLLLLSMVALVLDIGLLRIDRRDDQRTGDVAAVAAAMAMNVDSPRAGCTAAWNYFLENTPDATGPSGPDCTAWPDVPGCQATLGAGHDETLTGTAGPYAVELTWPVPDDHLLMDPEQVGRSDTHDGLPCERIGVSIRRERAHVFGVVMGHTDGASVADSVARATQAAAAEEVSSLNVLDPVGCETLRRTGGGSIHVRELTSPAAPGLITVDSNGEQCSGSNRVIDPNNGAHIRAGGTDDSDTVKSDDNGRIFSYALSGPWASFAYDSSDVPDNLSPAPEPALRRVTRAPMDEHYNTDDPATVEDEAYIDDLEADYGDAGDPVPAGFSIYGDDPGEKCTVGDDVTLPAGDWYIACGGKLLINGGTFRIGPGDVVTEGGIKLAGGVLSLNDDGTAAPCDSAYDPDEPHVLYLRSGDLVVGSSGSGLCLPEVFVHLRTGSLRLTGADILRWVAPEDDTHRFDDLAMWAESSDEFDMAGQAGVDLEGIWFAPNAGRSKANGDFQFSGGGGSVQTKAQFFTWRFTVTGGGTLVMTPDPERNLPTPILGVLLIR